MPKNNARRPANINDAVTTKTDIIIPENNAIMATING